MLTLCLSMIFYLLFGKDDATLNSGNFKFRHLVLVQHQMAQRNRGKE